MAGKLAGMSRGKGMAPNSEPNVIPFIDIMLVMLIIFMVAAPLPTVDVKVDLPPPGIPKYVESSDKPTIVAVEDTDGVLTYYIGDEIVPESRFQARLFDVVREKNPSMRDNLPLLFQEAKVFVDADQETTYDNVIGLINQVDKAGFKKVSLLVKNAAT